MVVSETVAQWQRFECTLVNAKSYDDPDRHVVLDVAITRSDGSRRYFRGFDDDGENWRVRFNPNQSES